MGYVTAGALRATLEDVPDDVPVVINVRCVHNDDWFHDPVVLEDLGLGVNDPDGRPVVDLGEIDCGAIRDDHPDGPHYSAYPGELSEYLTGGGA